MEEGGGEVRTSLAEMAKKASALIVLPLIALQNSGGDPTSAYEYILTNGVFMSNMHSNFIE